jgi:hypothetical protein
MIFVPKKLIIFPDDGEACVVIGGDGGGWIRDFFEK